MFEGNDVQNAFAFLSSRLKSTTVQKVQVCFREEAAPRQPNRIENGKFQNEFREFNFFELVSKTVHFGNNFKLLKMTVQFQQRLQSFAKD